VKQSQSQRNMTPRNPQPKAVSQQSPRLNAADCTATNSGTHAGENVPIAGDTGMHSAAQRNAIPEANVRKTVAKTDGAKEAPGSLGGPRRTPALAMRGLPKRGAGPPRPSETTHPVLAASAERTGDMWWQVQNLRCSWCRGTGRIRGRTSATTRSDELTPIVTNRSKRSFARAGIRDIAEGVNPSTDGSSPNCFLQSIRLQSEAGIDGVGSAWPRGLPSIVRPTRDDMFVWRCL
jgi:hypothetical protein